MAATGPVGTPPQKLAAVVQMDRELAALGNPWDTLAALVQRQRRQSQALEAATLARSLRTALENAAHHGVMLAQDTGSGNYAVTLAGPPAPMTPRLLARKAWTASGSPTV
jgi:hypothetical protein